MIYKLNKDTIQYMLTLPETGIGYQLINAKQKGSPKLKSFVVFNSEIIIENNHKLITYSNTLIGDGYQLLKDVLNFIKLEDIKLASWDENERHPRDNESLDLNETGLAEEDIFIRPSIYNYDNRIDLEKQVLLPGSYVTTLESYTNCYIMREDPFETYALPVPQQFVRVFYIKQNRNACNFNGVFSRAFGKKGGGIKLSFDSYGKVLIKNNDKKKITLTDKNLDAQNIIE